MGKVLDKMNASSKQAWSNAWKSSNIGGTLGSLTSGLTSVVSAGLENAKIKDTSAEEAAINRVENTLFSEGSYDNLMSEFDANNMARNNFTQKEVRGLNGWQMVGNTLKGAASGAMTGAQLGGIWGGIGGFFAGTTTGLLGIREGNRKAREKARELNNNAQLANASYLNNFSNSVENTQNTMFNNSLLNIASYGGPLFNHSGDWTNGLTFINAGGTHEQNPFEGVQVGVDPQGTPNLVEEGEIIYNDYVFSNRLKPTKKQLEDNGLNKKYEGWTFAKIVEDLQKESADSPIDFISQNTLEDMISILTKMQEEIRMKKNKTNSNRFDIGGPKNDNYLNTFVRNYINQAHKPLEMENEPPMFIPYVDKSEIIPTVSSVLNNNSTIQNNGKPVNTNLTTPVIDEPVVDRGNFNWQSLGRYAPVLADATALMTNLFTKPDYSNAEAGVKAMRDVPMVDVKPVGNYLQLDNLDRNYYLNPLLASSRGTARAIQNQGLNAGQTMAGLMSNQYNTNKGIGEASFTMDRENMARDLQEAQFNLGIDQYNANQAIQAQQMNQQRAYNIAQAEANAAQMREAIDAQRTAAISQSLSGLSEGLAGIGTESEQRSWLNGLIESGAIEDYLKGTKYAKSAKNGGKMLTKKYNDGGNTNPINEELLYPTYGSRLRAKAAYDMGARNPEAIDGVLGYNRQPVKAFGKTVTLNDTSKNIDDIESFMRVTYNDGLYVDTHMGSLGDNEFDNISLQLPNNDVYHVTSNSKGDSSYYEKDYVNALGMKNISKSKQIKKNGGRMLTKKRK